MFWLHLLLSRQQNGGTDETVEKQSVDALSVAHLVALALYDRHPTLTRRGTSRPCNGRGKGFGPGLENGAPVPQSPGRLGRVVSLRTRRGKKRKKRGNVSNQTKALRRNKMKAVQLKPGKAEEMQN
ncbi:unnamed protein product [Ixodes pacificus]